MCIQLFMIIHFLVVDGPDETVEAAEEKQQGNTFIVDV